MPKSSIELFANPNRKESQILAIRQEGRVIFLTKSNSKWLLDKLSAYLEEKKELKTA